MLWWLLNTISLLCSESSMPAEMTMLADHPARQLLDFSQKLDINLLDNVVNSMHHEIGSQVSTPPEPPARRVRFRLHWCPRWHVAFCLKQRVAQEVLTNLKDHPDAWTRVDTILEFSQNMKTKVSPWLSLVPSFISISAYYSLNTNISACCGCQLC